MEMRATRMQIFSILKWRQSDPSLSGLILRTGYH